MSYSYLDLARDVLRNAPKPMLYQEIWESASAKGLDSKLGAKGKTPWQSLGARLYVDVRDNQESEFVKVGTRPTRFFLKDRQAELSPDTIVKLDKEDIKKPEKKTACTERDLHPLRAYFAYSN